jgi:hypothetical protein
MNYILRGKKTGWILLLVSATTVASGSRIDFFDELASRLFSSYQAIDLFIRPPLISS